MSTNYLLSVFFERVQKSVVQNVSDCLLSVRATRVNGDMWRSRLLMLVDRGDWTLTAQPLLKEIQTLKIKFDTQYDLRKLRV